MLWLLLFIYVSWTVLSLLVLQHFVGYCSTTALMLKKCSAFCFVLNMLKNCFFAAKTWRKTAKDFGRKLRGILHELVRDFEGRKDFCIWIIPVHIFAASEICILFFLENRRSRTKFIQISARNLFISWTNQFGCHAFCKRHFRFRDAKFLFCKMIPVSMY